MSTAPINGFIKDFLNSGNLIVNYAGQQESCADLKDNMKPLLVNASNSSLSSSSSSSTSSSSSSSSNQSDFLPSLDSGGQINVEKSPLSPASSLASTITSSSASQPASQNHCEIAITANSNYTAKTKDEPEAIPRRTHVPYILNGQLYEIQTQEGENVTVKCCHCPSNRVYRGSVRSTGNFHMHIKRRHPELLEKLHEMRVHALLERRDRILRSRRHRQCNSRKRSTMFGSAMVSNLQFVRANKTLRLKRTLSNLSSISRGSLTPTNSPPPRPQTSLMEASILESKDVKEIAHTEQLEQEKSPETHKLKIRTVFQRHKMQQLRNHQEAINGGTVGEQSNVSLVLDKSSTTLLKNGHLWQPENSLGLISVDKTSLSIPGESSTDSQEMQVIDYSNKYFQQISLKHIQQTQNHNDLNKANESLQERSPIQTEDRPVSTSDLCHQTMLDASIDATLTTTKPFYKNYEEMNYERKMEHLENLNYETTAVDLQKLNEDINLNSYINRINFMEAAIKQNPISNLIKLENSCEVLDLSLRQNHSNIFVEGQVSENESTTTKNHTDATERVGNLSLAMEHNQQSISLSNDNYIPPREISLTASSRVPSEHHPEGTIEFSLNSMHLTKLEELIRNLDVSLRQLQQELSIRNCIERNRVCLDLAKFQFQNPNFQYKW